MSDKDKNSKALGLGTKPKDQWPTPSQVELEKSPISRLRPGSPEHSMVLQYLLSRLRMSEDKMQQFYARWESNEKRVQAYIDLPSYEKQLDEMNKDGKPPSVVSMVVPYSYATIATISTYHLHTFAGRKPIFQIGTHKAETASAARNMETVLQYNAEHTKYTAKLWQFLWDTKIYGVGVFMTAWADKKELRTVWKQPEGLLGQASGSRQRVREMRTVYQGNEIFNVDPYMFFPDPRVPMSEVNRRGEFVFWRRFEGRHEAKTLEADGIFKYVDNAGSLPTGSDRSQYSPSSRGLLSSGDSIAGHDRSQKDNSVQSFIQVDEASISIIPKELGLGESERPQKWLFTILNKRQIVRAQPLDHDHNMHPVAVAEPNTLGYGFGQPGIADYIGPLQDTLSWFINSHIHNVRTALNNMFVVDPSRIELQDLKNPGAGKIIRLKSAAFGQDIKQAIMQLGVSDVTANHTRDFELFMGLADALTGVTDNIRGIQDSGGRKTATEVRTSNEAGASRLAAESKLISAQAITDLATQLAINIQQFLDEDMYLAVVGNDGIEDPIQIMPEHLVGDFHFPIHDGTLPLDRVAMLDVWKEIFGVVSQNPNLSQRYDAGRIFEHIAELGGARDLKSFRVEGGMSPNPNANVSVLPDEQVEQAVQAGNAVPLPQSGTTPGVSGPPGARLAQ